MNKNLILKIICSLPVILLALYFHSFLGVCLIVLRCFLYSTKRISTPIFIMMIGGLLFIPKVIYFVIGMVDIDMNVIPYLEQILNSDIYNINVIEYSKNILNIGVVFLIVIVVLGKFFESIKNFLSMGMTSYIHKSIEKNAEISKQNDLEIKLKQEQAKNTGYVKCRNCGSDNLLSERFGVCKYCRQKLENKNYKI